MTTTTFTVNAPELALEALEAAIAKFNTATEEMTRATKTALMLVGAPLIGLAFVMALPVICAALTAYYGAKLVAVRWAGIARYMKNVALFFAAPFVGLAYIIAFPFVGLGALVYFGVKAARR
jgi:hypothetical protein